MLYPVMKKTTFASTESEVQPGQAAKTNVLQEDCAKV